MTLRLSVFIITTIIGLLFIIFPEWDLAITSKFYTTEAGFIYADNKLVNLSFRAIPIITKIWVVLCVFAVLKKFLLSRNLRETLKSPAIFLIIAALLGPALTVNYIFKENIGRARPKSIIEFGGGNEFTSPIEYSSACASNCSFSSGHAAMAFYFTALAYIVPISYQSIAFILASIFGFGVGLGRILQGGHFSSDVIFSFIVIMIINEISFKLWKHYAVRK